MNEILHDKQSFKMRWISFIIACLAFVAVVYKTVFLGGEMDKTIVGVFLTISAFAWGASALGIVKNIIKK